MSGANVDRLRLYEFMTDPEPREACSAAVMPSPGFMGSTTMQHKSTRSGRSGAARADTKRTTAPSLGSLTPRIIQDAEPTWPFAQPSFSMTLPPRREPALQGEGALHVRD